MPSYVAKQYFNNKRESYLYNQSIKRNIVSVRLTLLILPTYFTI